MRVLKNRYLILRRITQIAILVFFVLGNYSIATLKNVQQHSEVSVFAGDISALIGDSSSVLAKEPSAISHIVQGNLSYSSWFDGAFSMTDPLSFAQIVLAGGGLALDMVIGLVIVLALYGVLLGRAYCAFVCPINMVTDFANFLRTKLGFSSAQRKLNLSRNTRYVILAITLALSFVFGVAAFELVSPISMLHRGIAFGMGFGIFAILLIFVFDLFILQNGFCGHLCPLGATYSIIGKFALLRIKHNVNNCTKCMDCVRACPEPEVLRPIGKESGSLNHMACIRCGRCIEVCNDNALRYGIINFTKKEKK